ncbi:MAG TPA: flagellin lysine-N-methylase [Labilithrix sp.]|nr:flagellin lysine-N-methylase [Labilithrix sp.]
MPDAALAPRYFTRFSCLGGACEDTCCSSWSISVDADHHKKLRRALGQTKADREMFEKSVKRVRSGRTDAKFALIVLNPTTGYCNFLGADKLCSLHRRFGEPILPDVCSTYPRRQSLVGDRMEMTAALSCPEAARQALLPKDAMELVDVDPKVAVRDLFVQIAEGADVYETSLDVVRMSILQIIAGAPSLAAGLGTVAALADVLGESFGQGKPFDPALLAKTLDDFQNPARAEQVAAALATIDVPLEVPMRPLLQILAKRVDLPEGQFGNVLKHAVEAFAISENAVVVDVAKAYLARRELVAGVVDQRLNEILTNYALNHTFAQWFTSSSNLGVWVRGLILRVALIRFLAYAHPEIAALTSTATEGDAVRTVERVTIDTVYRLARTVDHHQPFVKLLDQVLPQTMPGLEHALCMLKM